MDGETSARASATVIQENFRVIDGDGSNSLSRDELDRYSNDPRRSEVQRNAAADFLDHFDLVREMAVARTSSDLPNDTAIAHHRQKFSDGTNANAITRRDVDVMLYDYSQEGVDRQIGDIRSAELKDGAMKTGVGVVITVAGAVLTVGAAIEAGPVAILPAAVAGLGATLVYSGARDLWGRASEPMRAEYGQRRDALQSW